MTSQNDDILEILNQIIDSGIAETTHSPKPLPPRTIETHAQIQKLPKPVDSTIIPGANQQRKFNELLAEFEIIKKQQQQDKQASQRLRLQYAVTKKKLQMATISLEFVIEENEALKQSLAPPEPITQLPELIKAITLITRLHQETQAEHLELHHQHQHSIHKVKQLASELHLLKTEHETLTQSHQQATQEIDILRSSANTAERRSHQLSEDQEALQKDLQRLREQIGKKDNEIDRLQQSLQNPPTSPAEHELKKENDALKAELKTVLGEFQNQTDSLEQLADKLVDIQSFESEFKQKKQSARRNRSTTRRTQRGHHCKRATRTTKTAHPSPTPETTNHHRHPGRRAPCTSRKTRTNEYHANNRKIQAPPSMPSTNPDDKKPSAKFSSMLKLLPKHNSSMHSSNKTNSPTDASAPCSSKKTLFKKTPSQKCSPAS
ncbi:MAG: hypothetical protein VCD00_11420 [Candidatus Hydrogenedentota bacterium]